MLSWIERVLRGRKSCGGTRCRYKEYIREKEDGKQLKKVEDS